MRIWVKDGEPIQNTLKRFKKYCDKEGIIKDIKRTMYYEKPSEKRKRKRFKSFKRTESNLDME